MEYIVLLDHQAYCYVMKVEHVYVSPHRWMRLCWVPCSSYAAVVGRRSTILCCSLCLRWYGSTFLSWQGRTERCWHSPNTLSNILFDEKLMHNSTRKAWIFSLCNYAAEWCHFHALLIQWSQLMYCNIVSLGLVKSHCCIRELLII